MSASSPEGFFEPRDYPVVFFIQKEPPLRNQGGFPHMQNRTIKLSNEQKEQFI